MRLDTEEYAYSVEFMCGRLGVSERRAHERDGHAAEPGQKTDAKAWISWAAAAVDHFDPLNTPLRLLADGRLHPALTPAGYDTWQAGPFAAAQRRTLDVLAAAFPPHGHCLPEPGPASLRIIEPTALVRRFCDAVADELVRTPAAPLAMGALPYSWRETRSVPLLHEWAEETAAAFTADVADEGRTALPRWRSQEPRGEGPPFLEVAPAWGAQAGAPSSGVRSSRTQ